MRHIFGTLTLFATLGTTGCDLLAPRQSAIATTAVVVSVDSTESGYRIQIEVQNSGDADVFLGRACRTVEIHSAGSWSPEAGLTGGCATVSRLLVPPHDFVRVTEIFPHSLLTAASASSRYRLGLGVYSEPGVRRTDERWIKTGAFLLN
jgi:hypothetical protein